MSTLDPDAAALLELQRSSGAPPLATMTPEQARAAHVAGAPAVSGPGEPVEDVSDADADGVPVRVYRPAGARGTTVYVHGGGWVVGTLDTYDHVCRALAVLSGTTVVSVDYALAPEARHPVAAEQTGRVLAWAAARAGDGTLQLAGDSAGAHLATLVAARTSTALGGLALVYPVVAPDLDTPSARENATGYGLETEGMRWYWRHYLPEEHSLPEEHGQSEEHSLPGPSGVPVDLRRLDLARLPRTLVLTAGFDPLRDEGLALADAVEAAGVPVERRAFPGQVHGFFRTDRVVRQAREAHEAVGAFLRAGR